MFHKHKWEKKEVVIAEPVTNIESFDGGGGRHLRALVQGSTTYVLECGCGDMKTVEAVGVRK